MQQSEIEVELTLRDAGSLRATAQVTFATAQGPLIVQGFKVVETQPGKPWVSLPSKEYQAGGQRRFQKIVELSKPGMKAVSQAILKEFEAQQKPA